MSKQSHEFLGMLESFPPKCGGKKDDGSGVCYGTEEQHEKPKLYRVTANIPEGGAIFLDPVSKTAVHLRPSGSGVKKLGRAKTRFYPGDVIWKSSESPAVWKFHGFAQTHAFTPREDFTGCASGLDSSQGLCGLPRSLHILPAILGETNPYVSVEIGRLRKNLAEDHRAAVKFAAEYQSWSTLKNSTEENKAACRQHAQVWQARAHALKLALEGLK